MTLYFLLMNVAMLSSALKTFISMLTPVILGALIAFVLNIILNFLELRLFKKLWIKFPRLGKRKRGICVFLTYIVAVAAGVFGLSFIITQVVKNIEILISNAPEYIKVGQDFLADISKSLGISNDLWNDLAQNWGEIVNFFQNYLSQLLSSLTTALGTIFDITITVASSLLTFLIAIILSVYMLTSKEKLIRIGKKLLAAFLPAKTAGSISYWSQEAYLTYSRFIGGQVVEAIILGLLCFIGMTIFGLPYAPLISIIVGIGNLIPIVGAYVCGGISTLLILLESPLQALIFLIFLIVIQQIEGNLIYPKVVGDAVGLNGIFVFLAVILSGKFFGIMGILLSVPAMAVLYALVGHIVNERLKAKGIEIEAVNSGNSDRPHKSRQSPLMSKMKLLFKKKKSSKAAQPPGDSV